ncbi:MAG: M20/M25/M40 family metallo-hydrolase [Myxococcota bacterium]
MPSPDVVELTLQLCRIPSVTGQEAAVVQFARQQLQQLGFAVHLQPLGEQGRANLLAHPPNQPPHVLLSTHLDTVPPHIAPTMSADQRSIRGRGTCDAKGIAAAMICAAAELRRQGEHRVGLLFVVGEETNSDGAKQAVRNFAPRVRAVIGGEPTQLQVVRAMKGAVVFRLDAQGKCSHSAYPELGHSALHQLVRDAQALLAEPWPRDEELGETTINIGLLQGGSAVNVLADHAWARGIVRCAVPARVVVDRIKALLEPATKLTLESASDPLRLHCPKGFDGCMVSFGSDMPHLRQLGTPLLVGPGSIHDAHQPHERISIQQLRQAVCLYQDLAKLLLEEIIEPPSSTCRARTPRR